MIKCLFCDNLNIILHFIQLYIQHITSDTKQKTTKNFVARHISRILKKCQLDTNELATNYKLNFAINILVQNSFLFLQSFLASLVFYYISFYPKCSDDYEQQIVFNQLIIGKVVKLDYIKQICYYKIVTVQEEICCTEIK